MKATLGIGRGDPGTDVDIERQHLQNDLAHPATSGSTCEGTMTETATVIRKAFCSECRGMRNCDVRGHHKDYGQEGDGYIQWWIDWYILQCRGCDHIFVQKSSADSENIHQFYNELGEPDSEHIETLSYWPALSKRQKPEWLDDFGVHIGDADELEQAIREVYGALDADLPILAAIGMRTCFDVAAILLGVEDNLPFAKKLDELVRLQKIGGVDKDRLALLVDAGSASVHRGWKPKPKELETLAEILEHFVFEAFVAPSRRSRLDAEAKKLEGNVPSRKRKKAEAPTTEAPTATGSKSSPSTSEPSPAALPPARQTTS
ncbi:DUF4145 domain-containing protein [Mesorhizobium sp. AA23]|uniref:DUF4145 domain-containing protein n=1 Tax=Mesorhizobium sp. AA23 TaxID=1854058 RepID=UPI00082EA8F2|nr:DUF4145 domain-containing protein [Mesorhizobium sp. AA23]